jgi:hypothetical protein
MKTDKLVRYMKLRSKIEGTEWGLDIDYLENHFDFGIRHFFGVHLDDKGNLLFDDQEPFKGFFNNWEMMMSGVV